MKENEETEPKSGIAVGDFYGGYNLDESDAFRAGMSLHELSR